MILVDTSAWVEYDRATGSPVDRRLTELITDEGPIAVTEPVVWAAAGARTDEREVDLRRLLLRFALLTSTRLSTSMPRRTSTERAGGSVSRREG